MDLRQLFLRHVAQTSEAPIGWEIMHAEGCILTDSHNRKYIDLIGGISVAATGHRHPRVLEAIRDQLERYLHVMVYGELVQSPQVSYAEALAASLPSPLSSVYFTNSGAEAVEGAMKLAKRATGRSEIVCFEHSYHGSTQGALSLIGDEYWRQAYRPLLPGIQRLRYNVLEDLGRINRDTACVVAETVQAEAGVRKPSHEWMQVLRDRCTETGALLVLDEIQAGFGRTGTLWGFEQYGIVPDVLLLGKALGGGLPLGAFVASEDLMRMLTHSPVLGHLTTFGGHPLSCAAGLAAFEVLQAGLVTEVPRKEKLFRANLRHPQIKAVHSAGLWMGVEFESAKFCKGVIDRCAELGVFTDWFLFADHCLRISPPLVISDAEIQTAREAICEAADGVK